VYSNGVLYTKTGQSTSTIQNLEGQHHIYFDSDGVLQNSQVFGPDIIRRWAYVAGLYWDATNQQVIHEPLNETHGVEMPAEVHSYLHLSQKTKYLSGCPLTVNALGDGSSDDHIRFSSASGVIADEDITHTVVSRAITENVVTLYRLGATGAWRQQVSSFPVILGANLRPQYNLLSGGVWSLAETPSNDAMLIHLFAIPGIDHNAAKIVVVTGQASYATVALARTGASKEANRLALDNFPFSEAIQLFSLVVDVNTVYTNSQNARFVQSTNAFGDLTDYLDWRNIVKQPS
jgi:hypothetical protein